MEYTPIDLQSVPPGKELPFDLYVNSSTVPGRPHFVRIHAAGGALSAEELAAFGRKYPRIEVTQEQRPLYLKMLLLADRGKLDAKGGALRDSAILHLNALFEGEQKAETLRESVLGCRNAVIGMVDLLQDQSVSAIQEMISRLTFHDVYTYDHSVNVAMYSILLYRDLNAEAKKEKLVQAGLAAMLHDLGKIRIPARLLNQPNDDLLPEDFAEIRMHPHHGRELLECHGPGPSAELDTELLIRVAHEHHEHFDGTGYPRKLYGNGIHLGARITAVADLFDSLTTRRAGHDPLSIHEALTVMSRTSGKKLDGRIFCEFLGHAGEFKVDRGFRFEIPDEFDPCQPRKQLSLKSVPR